MLPRRTRPPRRIEIGTGEPTYPVTAQDYYRRIYFEAIDLMMNATDQRFDQPSFDTYAKMESLLIKTLNSQDKSEELKFMEKLYNDDVNISVLIIYKQQFLHSDWLRTCQLIPNQCKKCN